MSIDYQPYHSLTTPPNVNSEIKEEGEIGNCQFWGDLGALRMTSHNTCVFSTCQEAIMELLGALWVAVAVVEKTPSTHTLNTL